MRRLTIWQAVVFATELGIALAVTVLVGLLLGHMADDRLGLELPAFTMLGALAGLAAGVYSSVHMMQFLTRPGKE
jgi:hypothetical protein